MSSSLDNLKKNIISNQITASALATKSNVLSKPAETAKVAEEITIIPEGVEVKVEEVVAEIAEEIVEIEAIKFQHYKSARIAMKMITEKGKKIIFTGYEFITNDEELIEYLDKAIKDGVIGITKGKLMTTEEADPMAALKRKHFAEFEKQRIQAAVDKASGVTRNMGDSKEPGAASINPANTDHVAN